MSYFANTPWDKHFPITGTYEWHQKYSPFAPDPGVDYGLPNRTPIYSPYSEQYVQQDVVKVNDGLGDRIIVTFIEKRGGEDTGNKFQVWHCDEVLIKGALISGRVLAAYSGMSGANHYHAHCVEYRNKRKIDPTPHIEEIMTIQDKLNDALTQLETKTKILNQETIDKNEVIKDRAQANSLIGDLKEQLATAGEIIAEKNETIQQLTSNKAGSPQGTTAPNSGIDMKPSEQPNLVTRVFAHLISALLRR